MGKSAAAYADQTADKRPPILLQWIDLLPEAEQKALKASHETLIEVPPLPDLGSLDSEQQPEWLALPVIGSQHSVSKHNHRYVELVGYPVPLKNDQDTDSTTTSNTITSFLLVPELGAGLVNRQPPPNQTVRINLSPMSKSLEKAAPPTNMAIRVRGVLQQINDKTNLPYAYVIEADDWSW